MADQGNESHADNTMRAIQNKKQVPEIDFTLHTMEDGTQVSTQERVCKGMKASRSVRTHEAFRIAVDYAEDIHAQRHQLLSC
jgi:hypothetical protein